MPWARMHTVRSADRRIRHIFEGGLRLLAYRAKKLGRLRVLKIIGYWERLGRQTGAFWNQERAEQWLRLARSDELLIGPRCLKAFREWCRAHPDAWTDIRRDAEAVAGGKISIFDRTYEFDTERMPWTADWRWQHTWPPTYFRKYRFYFRNKAVPYDVKFPWELSRLSFLLPLAQLAAATGEPSWRKRILAWLVNWEQQNPVAYSVNWCAMEASMRGISLALIAQILATDRGVGGAEITPLLRQLSLHGEFIARNVEYTGLGSNHYSANLVALLVIGDLLRAVYPPAAGWYRMGVERIPREIEAQFCKDGVNYEKATSYHHLVTELFLLGLLHLAHNRETIPPPCSDRLRLALEYVRSYIRPDGLSPNLGDNDGARLFTFERVAQRDHRPLLTVGAALFSDRRLKATGGRPSASLPWLMGGHGLEEWTRLATTEPDEIGAVHFSDGGVFIARTPREYLLVDVGAVGLGGKGGHGHNDTLSFELCLHGRPIIVDSGSPTYTGDLRLYDRFRSTDAHNTLRLDGVELAELIDVGRISDLATPTVLSVRSTPGMDRITAEHRGYCRLPDPVVHRRCLSFCKSARPGRLICLDILLCRGEHSVEQFLHFSPEWIVRLEGDRAVAENGSACPVEVRWTPGGKATIAACQVSETYAHLEDSRCLIISHRISGASELRFEVAPVERP